MIGKKCVDYKVEGVDQRKPGMKLLKKDSQIGKLNR